MIITYSHQYVKFHGYFLRTMSARPRGKRQPVMTKNNHLHPQNAKSQLSIRVYIHLCVWQAFPPADARTLSAGNTNIWQEISMNLYISMRICNKHYSFPSSTVSLTAGLMCFIHFRMSINVQVMPQMSIFLTRSFSTLSRVRRKQQIKEHPA